MDHIDLKTGDHTTLRCSVKLVGVQMFIDIRKWVNGDDANVMFPTRKGVLINSEHLRPLIANLNELLSANKPNTESNNIT
jgi:hypothetical protein